MAGGAGAWTAAWEALRAGRPGEAERLARAALAAEPAGRAPDGSAEGWFLLGVACHDLDRPAEAADCFRRTLDLQPDSPDAHNALGLALLGQGRPAEAAECFRQALDLRPGLPEAHNNLGSALNDLGRLDEAERCFRRAVALRPDYPAALYNLGNALRELGQPGQAVACFQQALTLQPGLLQTLKSPDRGPRAHQAQAESWLLLGVACHRLGWPREAAECYARALEQRPDYAEALLNLGAILKDQGRIDEALACYRRTLGLWPDYAVAHSALLLALHYQAGVTPQELLAEHADYQARHAAPLRATWRPHGNDRDPERPLRLGFVSPDLGWHPVGYFLVRAAEALARRPVTAAYYSSRAKADELTGRFQAAASLWRDVLELSDEQLAEQVRADGIDILIDLAGHTAGNRILVFARQPAPVQVTWLGYVGTTGLEAIDYLIADPWLVPPGSEDHHRERVLRLPGGHAGYDPPAYAPEPAPVPALTAGRVTFGCFNNPAKLSAPALAAFADVLRRVPGARLILKYRGVDDPAVAQRLLGLLAAGDVDPGRVEFRAGTAHTEHLAAYREIDIALDPFPYAGVMTTIDALWMGVPVVTLAGDTFASRHGLGLLSVVGLADELAANTVDDYAQRAAGLAANLSRLSELRAGLRERVARSTLCDGERLADELLTVLRTAWRAWAS